jgi:hypothetical protein
MGILDTTNLSWSTGKVSKSKEVMILCYYGSKHIKYTRSDDFSNKKKQESHLFRKITFSCS